MDTTIEEASEGLKTPIQDESRVFSANPTPRLTPKPSTLNIVEQISRTNSGLKESETDAKETDRNFSHMLLPPKEEKKFTIGELFEDLKKKVGIELRKVAFTDPPKKQQANQTGFQPPKKEKKKKKKRVPFSPVNGVKRTPQYTAQITASPELTRISNLLSGWGDTNAVNDQDEDGVTALMLASEKGRQDIVDLLLKKGASLDMKDKWGKTAIHRSAAKGIDQMTTMLINSGADLNCQDSFGNTPLHSAIRNSQKNVVAQLIIRGADFTIKNRNNEIPLDKAKSQDFKHFVEGCITTAMKKNKKKQITASKSPSFQPSALPQIPTPSSGGQFLALPTDEKLPLIKNSSKSPSRASSRPLSAPESAKLPPVEGAKKLDEEKKEIERIPSKMSKSASAASADKQSIRLTQKEILEADKKRREDKKQVEIEKKEKRKQDEEKRKEEEVKRKEEEERNRIVDLAAGVRTWSSGVFDPVASGKFGPEKVVDGDDSSRWCGHPPESAWIALDLEFSCEIHSIRIRYERAYASEYCILIADDTEGFEDTQEAWKCIVRRTDGHEGWNEIALNSPEKARYLKIQEEKAAVEGWGMSIFQIEVNGKRGAPKVVEQETIIEQQETTIIVTEQQEVRKEQEHVEEPLNEEMKVHEVQEEPQDIPASVEVEEIEDETKILVTKEIQNTEENNTKEPLKTMSNNDEITTIEGK